MNVGKRIQARRKELNISVDELAKRLNKNRTTIYRYENGWVTNMPGDNNIYLPRESAYNAIDEILGEKAHTPHPKRLKFGVTIIGRKNDAS